MAPKENSSIGPVAPEPLPTVVVPTIQSYDLDALFPPRSNTVTNSALPDPSTLDNVDPQSRQFVLRTPKPGDPIPYVMGRSFVKPALIGADDSGEFLVLDLMWGTGPMQRVANGIVPSEDPPGTWDHSIKFPDLGLTIISGGQYEHFTGTSGQPASSIMTTLKGSYPSYPGIAHSVITMQQGWNLNIVGACDGIMVIDPRVSFSTKAWTQNPALLLADMVIRCGYNVDWDSVADTADYDDELVGDPGSEIERWKIAGVIYDRADLRSWISAMQQYAHCFVDKVGDTIFLRPDKPRASSHAVVADDVVRGTARMRTRGTRNTVEGVRVTFNFSLTTLDAEFGTFDDPGTVSQLRMPFWAGSFPYLGSHAKRHAEEVYNKSQLEIEDFEYVTFDKGLERTVGDVGTITYAPFNLQAREMLLIDIRQEGRGRWRLRYTDYSSDVYPETNYDDLEYTQTDLYNPYSPPDGPEPTLDWELETSMVSGTSSYPFLTLEWTGLVWAYIKDYAVRVYRVGSPDDVIYDSLDEDDYVPHSAGVIVLDLSDRPVEMGATYQADVYIRSIVDALSPEPGSDTVEVILESNDPCIYWTTTPFTSSVVDDNSQPYNNLYFYEHGSGVGPQDPYLYSVVGYWQDKDTIVRDFVIDIDACHGGSSFEPGDYLIKVEGVSGDTGQIELQNGDHSLGEWFDLFRANVALYIDDIGSYSAEIDITVATDDGTGSPVDGSETQPKRVTMYVEKTP